jgi:hypothetical protein
MYARAIDDAGARLRELHHEQAEEFGVALVALVLAVAATQVHPAFALPLLLGGLFVGARGVRACWRRWDLIDRLAGSRDAYVLAEVSAYAERQATVARRRTFAAAIRSTLQEAAPSSQVVAAASDLEALAAELEDDSLALDPSCAVACMRLAEEPEVSPLLDPAAPAGDLQSRVYRIRAGFSLAPSAAPHCYTNGAGR